MKEASKNTIQRLLEKIELQEIALNDLAQALNEARQEITELRYKLKRWSE